MMLIARKLPQPSTDKVINERNFPTLGLLFMMLKPAVGKVQKG